jgi:FMN-dependent NADH-azoreductase
MRKVLFVKTNNRPVEQAVSVKLYEAFLKNYVESHPEDQVTEQLHRKWQSILRRYSTGY